MTHYNATCKTELKLATYTYSSYGVLGGTQKDGLTKVETKNLTYTPRTCVPWAFCRFTVTRLNLVLEWGEFPTLSSHTHFSPPDQKGRVVRTCCRRRH